MHHIYQIHPVDCQPLRPANDNDLLRQSRIDAYLGIGLLCLSAAVVVLVALSAVGLV